MKTSINKVKKLISKRQTINIFFGILLVIGFIFVIFPFLHDGFFPTMDDVQVLRIDVMTQELLSGQFPVRYVNNFGNRGGYMLFNFYSPLAYYIGAIIHSVGFTLVKATKIDFILAYMVGMGGMLFLLKLYSDWITSVLGTLLFITSSYLSFDVYTRGSLGELWGFCLLPWVIAYFLRIKYKHTKNNMLLSGVAYALLIVAHNITAFAGSLLLLILLLTPPYQKKSFLGSVLAICIGIGLSAFFWLPIVIEQKYIVYSKSYFTQMAYKTNFLNPLQISGIQHIPWSFKPPILGIGLCIGAIISIFFWKRFSKTQEYIFLFAITGFFISTFFVWDISKTFWDNILYLQFMQFPWRFLTLITLCSVISISLWLSLIKNIVFRVFFCFLLLLPVFFWQFSYLRPSTYNYISVYKAEDMCSTTTWDQELLPVWVSRCLPKNGKIPLVHSTDKTLAIRSIISKKNGREITFTTSGKQGIAVITKYYFPGWYGYIDGEQVALFPKDKYGLIHLVIPSGVHNVAIKLESSTSQRIANAISLCTIILLCYAFFRYSKKII